MEIYVDETTKLIERIKKWKAEKDEREYREKIEEENKVANFMEKMNSKILEDSKNILKIHDTIRKCEIKTDNLPCYSIKIAYNSGWCLRFEFRHCIGFVFPDSKNVSFKKKDRAGYSTDDDSNPPHSSEFDNFFENFKYFKEKFYDFVEQALK